MWGGCFLWSGATPFRWCALYFSYAKADYVFEIPDILVNDVNIQQKTSQRHPIFSASCEEASCSNKSFSPLRQKLLLFPPPYHVATQCWSLTSKTSPQFFTQNVRL